MTEFVFSDASKKLISEYLKRAADIELRGYSNSYTQQNLDDCAKDTLHQMLRDNPEITGFAAMRKEVADECGDADFQYLAADIDRQANQGSTA